VELTKIARPRLGGGTILCQEGKNCISKWQHHDREIPNMIRLQQLSHLIGGQHPIMATLRHDDQDAVHSQVVASFLERGGLCLQAGCEGPVRALGLPRRE